MVIAFCHAVGIVKNAASWTVRPSNRQLFGEHPTPGVLGGEGKSDVWIDETALAELAEWGTRKTLKRAQP